jgi:hypothetical protein
VQTVTDASAALAVYPSERTLGTQADSAAARANKRFRRMLLSGGRATRSLDGADPTELPNPGYGGPVEQHLDRRLSLAFDKQTVRLGHHASPGLANRARTVLDTLVVKKTRG